MAGIISYKKRTEINDEQWNRCIQNAANGLVYGFSFYLDAMCTHWDALVWNDYEAVMPLPWRKKYGISYLYQPPFTAQLGIFGNGITPTLFKEFLSSIPKKFRYWDFPLNHQNQFILPEYPLFTRSNYVLSLHKPYEQLYSSYRENIKRNIKKAANYGCYTQKDIELQMIINLVQQQSARLSVKEEDLSRFKRLYELMRKNGQAITYGVFSKTGELIASCVFTFSHHRAYYILVGNHPNGRTLGASHSLIDSFIKDYAGQNLLLDFEGGDMRNLAFFYSSFGATEEKYTSIKLNRLPWWLKWLKS